MKQIQLLRLVPFLGLVSILLTPACTEKWDEHYNEDSFNLTDKTLTQYIQEKPELSTFSGMLRKAGYDKILNASQSYTVWAPNNDALQGIDTTDEELVLEIVRNHIARSRITTSGINVQPVRMLNGKYIYFTREASGFSFADNFILETNLPAINGLLHIIEGYAPYEKNLWEFIGRTVELDSVKSYLYGQSKLIFDPVNSVEIGVNSEGQVIYDTIFELKNPVLEIIGSIDLEDSIYTAIIPNNTAWNEAYSRIESYYNFPDDGGSVVRQREKTQWTLVKDMVYRGIVEDPGLYDSLVSTTGIVYYNPGYLFSGKNMVPLSNGQAYVADQMPFHDTISWFKEIRVEAEETEGRVNASTNIFLRNSYGSGLNVSDNQYILVDPTSVGPSVEFSIPNTLSAKYNIYCVFVPASIVNPSNTVTAKVNFVLTYIRRESGSVSVRKIIPENNITNPYGLTKMLVAQFEFEYANVIDEDYERLAVKLKVFNEVTIEEEQAGEFSRTMRIDCIILEPVIE